MSIIILDMMFWIFQCNAKPSKQRRRLQAIAFCFCSHFEPNVYIMSLLNGVDIRPLGNFCSQGENIDNLGHTCMLTSQIVRMVKDRIHTQSSKWDDYM